jgi:hypothetical protein
MCHHLALPPHRGPEAVDVGTILGAHLGRRSYWKTGNADRLVGWCRHRCVSYSLQVIQRVLSARLLHKELSAKRLMALSGLTRQMTILIQLVIVD